MCVVQPDRLHSVDCVECDVVWHCAEPVDRWTLRWIDFIYTSTRLVPSRPARSPCLGVWSAAWTSCCVCWHPRRRRVPRLMNRALSRSLWPTVPSQHYPLWTILMLGVDVKPSSSYTPVKKNHRDTLYWLVVIVALCTQAMHNVSNACGRSADELLQCLQSAVDQRKIPFCQAGYDTAGFMFLSLSR